MDGADETTESLSEWEQIQFPTVRPREPDMFVARDDLSVFPPSSRNEEPNLKEPLQDAQVQEELNSSVASSPSSKDDSPKPEPLKIVENRANYKSALRSGIERMVARVRCYVAACGWGCGSFGSSSSVTAVVAAATLLSLVYVKVRKWRRTRRGRAHEEKNFISSPFTLLLQEKDQKINELLLQITQMKELLSARRGRVPVIRIA